MMFNKIVPPEYLTFEDYEFWRVCCLTFGDYDETVITDNGDNTVDIVVTYKSQLNPGVVKKSVVISSTYGVDNTGGTYTAGTTKAPVGITQRQCDAITWFGRSGNSDNHAYFYNNKNIQSVNDLRYFTNLTELRGNAGRSDAFGAFASCTNITSAILPASLYRVGDDAFIYTSLSSINLDNIRYIGKDALKGTQLTSIVLNNCISIGTTAAYNISTLVYVDLPSTITSIDKNAFASTPSKVVVCRALTPPTVGSSGMGFISKIYVPNDSLDTYKSASYWSSYASKIEAIEGTWYETHKELEPTT